MVSLYLINNQCDKHAVGKTKVDFNLKLVMDLQWQAAVSQGIPELFSSSLPLVTMLIRFLSTQESILYPSFSLAFKAFLFTHKGPAMVNWPSRSLVGDHKAASPFQRCNLSWHRWPSSLLLQGSWVCFPGGYCKTTGVFIEGSKAIWWRDDDRRCRGFLFFYFFTW